MKGDAIKPPSFQHDSAFVLPAGILARVLFEGRDRFPEGSCGYVRSEARAARALASRSGQDRPAKKIPFRDYPQDVLTRLADLRPAPYKGHHLISSARNSLNEFGYQVRVNGKWWRRWDDGPIDGKWPVLAVALDGMRIVRLADAEPSGADLVTGIPLVMESRAVTREFLVANCSDAAHTFEVHPKGLIGAPPPAWQELSNAWEELRTQNLSDIEVTARLDSIARRHGALPSRNLLHSVVASLPKGQLLFAAITGSLDGIARLLVTRWRARDAFVLDNGGSVAWAYFSEGEMSPKLLLSGPNHRPAGTVFLDITLGTFPQPVQHAAVDASGERVQ